jgi:uncharacterized FAD-dependent dehydrogenase
VTDGAGERRVRGVHLQHGEYIEADHVVLAIGHSARDTFAMLHARGLCRGQAVFDRRADRTSAIVDRQRRASAFARAPRSSARPNISIWHHCKNGRTVYSFCMCPAARVVAATSEEGRVVTNGMSQYSRAERNANSGLVVAIDPARLSPAIRWRASRSSGIGRIARPMSRAGRATRRRHSGRRFPGGPRLDRARLGGRRPTSPA